jgi:hypothetical protein
MPVDPEVTLPVDTIETPGEWGTLDEDFLDALRLASDCAGDGKEEFTSGCVHIHPEYVEGFDGRQALRYLAATGVVEPFLVRKDAARHAAAMGVAEIAESTNWVHFRAGAGLTLSCRRYLEDYPELGDVLEPAGESIGLPKGLGMAAEIAEIFSSENADYNLIEVRLSPGKAMIVGTGASGQYEEVKKVDYSGPSFSFLIAPQLLAAIVKGHSRAQVSPDKLSINGGRWLYVSILQPPDAGEGIEEDCD